MSATVGCCPGCDGSQKLLVPLHGDKGGRLLCLQCGLDWHAKQAGCDARVTEDEVAP